MQHQAPDGAARRTGRSPPSPQRFSCSREQATTVRAANSSPVITDSDSCAAETSAPPVIAQSAGAAKGIHGPAPVRAPTCATTSSPTVAPTPASKERPSVAAHAAGVASRDRKSTRLNSSHVAISYAVFCLKKKIIRNNGNKQSSAISKKRI